MCLVLPVFPCPLGFFLKQFPGWSLRGAASTSELRIREKWNCSGWKGPLRSKSPTSDPERGEKPSIFPKFGICTHSSHQNGLGPSPFPQLFLLPSSLTFLGSQSWLFPWVKCSFKRGKTTTTKKKASRTNPQEKSLRAVPSSRETNRAVPIPDDFPPFVPRSSPAGGGGGRRRKDPSSGKSGCSPAVPQAGAITRKTILLQGNLSPGAEEQGQGPQLGEIQVVSPGAAAWGGQS